MSTVTLARRDTSRHTGGPSSPDESWEPGVGYGRPDADPYHLQRISMRSPAASSAAAAATTAGSHSEASESTSKGNNGGSSNGGEGWWQASRRSSSLDVPQAPLQQQQQQQQQQQLQLQPPAAGFLVPSVWPEGSSAPLEYGGGSNSNTIRGGSASAASASGKGYLPQPPPFDAEDRLEIFARRPAGFGTEQPGGESAWRVAQGEPASGSGLEVWPSAYGGIDPSAAGMPWSRQVGGGGGHHDLRQIRQDQPESVSGPSQRLHEMKEYFRRNRASTAANEHDRHPYPEGAGFRPRPDIIVHDNRRENNEQGQGGGSGGGGDGREGGGRQGGRMPWQEGADAYPPSASASAADPPAETTPAVGIVNPPSGDGGDNDGRAWEEATAATAGAPPGAGGGGTSGGNDGGDVGVGVEFDPQADCRQAHPGQVAAGGSPTSWWRDAPEPIVSTFPWDLQLPNPAPPLALPHAPVDIRGIPEPSGVNGGGVSPSSAAAAAAAVAAAEAGGGSSSLRGGAEHPPLCRCETCRFGKAALHTGRHRANDRLQYASPFDMLEAPGRGGLRGNSGAVLMDAAARGAYGALRWGANPPPQPSATEVAWGLGGGSGSGGSGGVGYLSTRKMGEARRGGAPSCDSFIPPGPHAPSYSVVPTYSRGMPLMNNPLVGPERFASQDLEDEMGGAFDGRDARGKRARITKREGLHLSSGGTGISSGDPNTGHRLGRGGGRGGSADGSESGASGGGGGSRAHRGKKAPASSRRCRAEACQSHPNFGVEGDRRALYCAKHKLHGMVNVKAPRCRHPGCTRNPVYGHAGDPRATFCLSHKGPLMVDVKNRCCEHQGCKHQPSFGMAGDRRANFCFAHKLPSHVNIRRARARATC